MFYQFRQNNSGGEFHFDKEKGISVYVIIEANFITEANQLAEQIGLYFDGCEKGIDCNCCGDRWYALWSDAKGDEVPSVYKEAIDFSKPIDKEKMFTKWMKDKAEGFVHYLDGRVVPFWEE